MAFPERVGVCRVRGSNGRFLVLGLGPNLFRVVSLDEVGSKEVPASHVYDLKWRWPLPLPGVDGPSEFRGYMDVLKTKQGISANWNHWMRLMADSEVRRQSELPGGYQGEVFKDRDDKTYPQCISEAHWVANLFHVCRKEANGRLVVADEVFWLLGFQWPNQGGNAEKGMRADLVGMSCAGGLAVFECKLANNQDAPFTAMAEGLDYLGNLLRKKNFKKIAEGFTKWRAKPEQVVPPGFENAVPTREARPYAIVLAPAGYWDRHAGGHRENEAPWRSFVNIGCPAGYVTYGFAVSDFNSANAEWYGPHNSTTDPTPSAIPHDPPAPCGPGGAGPQTVA